MDQEAALRKLFAQLSSLVDRVDELNPNGRLDAIQEQLSRLENQTEKTDKKMAAVEANSMLVVSSVKEHGGVIEDLRRLTSNLRLGCPLLVKTEENTSSRSCRDRPTTGELEELKAAADGGGD